EMIIAEREPVWDKKEDQKNHIILSEYRDFEKQYDAESHPRLRNINERKFCFGKHKWENAYLRWSRYDAEKIEWTVEIPSNKHNLIRFCVRCKLIDCIHYWKEEDYKVYEVRNGEKTGFIVVRKCEICGLRIMVWDASNETYQTFEEEVASNKKLVR
ncbi:unnamed protein product, partial [marine sediment metagenome]